MRRNPLPRGPGASLRALGASEDLAEYRRLLAHMHEQEVELGGKPRTWNRLVDRMQTVQLRLRKSPEGRRGITALAETGESETARDWAAAHALFWDAERVRPLLESVAQEDTLRGLAAKTVLREFDAGRLTMEWVPKGG